MLGRRLILGTEPEVDPLKEISERSMTMASGTNLEWDKRSLKTSYAKELFTSLILILISASFPWIILAVSVGLVFWILVIPRLRKTREEKSLALEGWNRVPESDTSCSVSDDGETLQCRGSGGPRFIVGMELSQASPLLTGNISALVRAIDSSHGFSLSVSMRPESAESLVEEERLSDRIDQFLGTLSGSGLNSYMGRRGGLWSSRVLMLGHILDQFLLKDFESSVHAAIPDSHWDLLDSKEVASLISAKNMTRQPPSFFAAGSELSDWLVQLPSELASEIGSNVPGEFLAPIKSRPGDYHLGRVINPETLQLGPIAGLSPGDMRSGLLVCGGTLPERRHVLSVLIQELLKASKRVLVVSSDRDAKNYTSLSDGAVAFELGKDLVLNPVDSEGIPRHIYVSKLMTALEVISGTDLRAATDLELALNRAIALGNTTVADVQLNPVGDVNEAYSDGGEQHERKPSDKSMAGFEAIRSLHQGAAARSFYGSQTVATRSLTEVPVSVVVVAQGYLPMEKFAFDLMCIKLSGLQADPNLVVILENAENMRIRNRRYMKRDSWSEMMLRDLAHRGPTIVTLDHPVDMAPGAIGRMSSCITLRLREGPDIKTAVELLGISVISSGMHSKARHSSRETSYLRVMPDGVALLVRNQGETCMPIQLDETIPLAALGVEEMQRRVSRILPTNPIGHRTAHGDSLIDQVTGGQSATAVKILQLLERYEPLTEESLRKFILTGNESGDPDIGGVLARLEHAGMILRGHEVHGAVSYTNYRITMKGSMALRQVKLRDESEQ
ncbi:MAG: hypothetical protein ACFFD6_05520 [Candidatus Thorarchaeota archaeon]